MINERNLEDLKITLKKLKDSVSEVEEVVNRLECSRDWGTSIYSSDYTPGTSIYSSENPQDYLYDTDIDFELAEYDTGLSMSQTGATNTSLVMDNDEINDLQLSFTFDEEDLKSKKKELGKIVQFPFPDQQRP